MSSTSSTDDATAHRTVRWAILGTGSIATDMTQILRQLPATEVLAVGSRTQASADRFADRWSIPRRYPSYEAACADPDVDVVYVATPSLRHPDDCRLALQNGKAVLCEKSTVNGSRRRRQQRRLLARPNAAARLSDRRRR